MSSSLAAVANNVLFCRVAVRSGLITADQAKKIAHASVFAGDIAKSEGWIGEEDYQRTVAIMERFLHPKRVAGYEITAELGRGGMGCVYRAVQVSMQRPVAIKIMLPQYALSGRYSQRFLEEAQAAGRINHPNVISCYDVGEDAGLLFMVMELMTGGDLRHLMQVNDGQLSPGHALTLAADCARGLQAIDRAGLVHRDIKPSNIFITEDGFAKVADLGLVQDGEAADGNATKQNQAIGTPAYMSPEQAEQKQVDIRSDIYSLGITLLNMITGRLPYLADNPMEIMRQVVYEPVPNLEEWGLPRPLAKLVSRAIAKDPLIRPSSPTEFLDDIETTISSLENRGEADALTTARKESKRHQDRYRRKNKPGTQSKNTTASISRKNTGKQADSDNHSSLLPSDNGENDNKSETGATELAGLSDDSDTSLNPDVTRTTSRYLQPPEVTKTEDNELEPIAESDEESELEDLESPVEADTFDKELHKLGIHETFVSKIRSPSVVEHSAPDERCPQCGAEAYSYASICACGCDLDAWRIQRAEQQAKEDEDTKRREREAAEKETHLVEGVSVGSEFLSATQKAEEARQNRKGLTGFFRRKK